STDVPLRFPGDAGLAQTELPPPTVQQQEGAPGTAPHDGPGNYLAWAVGQSEYYRPCPSVFACGSPYATRIGAEPIIEHDLTKARQLVVESGYDGRPIVVLQTTDRPILNAAVVVIRQRLESIGFKVILKGLLWSTYLAVRARKEPPDKGGWNLLH